jgi:hypothetical protein
MAPAKADVCGQPQQFRLARDIWRFLQLQAGFNRYIGALRAPSTIVFKLFAVIMEVATKGRIQTAIDDP